MGERESHEVEQHKSVTILPLLLFILSYTHHIIFQHYYERTLSNAFSTSSMSWVCHSETEKERHTDSDYDLIHVILLCDRDFTGELKKDKKYD